MSRGGINENLPKKNLVQVEVSSLDEQLAELRKEAAQEVRWILRDHSAVIAVLQDVAQPDE